MGPTDMLEDILKYGYELAILSWSRIWEYFEMKWMMMMIH
jgi:hypothetical protein